MSSKPKSYVGIAKHLLEKARQTGKGGPDWKAEVYNRKTLPSWLTRQLQESANDLIHTR